MNEPVKIIGFEAQNVKRIKAVQFSPNENGLTIIGGDNAQGKTSLLDAIAWALGGNKFMPSNPAHGNDTTPELKVNLSNGLIVERTGKNSSLKVTDPSGKKAGQELLNSFIEVLALNLPKFMQADDKEKAKIVLDIIGVEEKLNEIRAQYQIFYDERTEIGRIESSKRKHAEELPHYPDAPEEEMSASTIIEEQKKAMEHNAAIDAQADAIKEKKRTITRIREMIGDNNGAIDNYNAQIEELTEKIKKLRDNAKECAQKNAECESLLDTKMAELAEMEKAWNERPEFISMDGFKTKIEELETTNEQVRANRAKTRAIKDARASKVEYDELTAKVEKCREDEQALLDGAKMPLKGLTIVDGTLRYNGQKWDCMSGSEQLIVACSIVRALKPECGFVLMDKLEAMDMKTLKEFNDWLFEEKLQVIATRVSKGDECSIIIEDGVVSDEQR